MSFERVAVLSEIPSDRGLCVRVGGREVGLYRVGERIYAMDNLCPHAGFPLNEGRVEGRVIECAAHGWPFDLETGLPPDTGGTRPIPRFPVRIDGDAVLIDTANPLP
jgi:nitrite reductase/ring-hydroxylating ferredoxin subunit